MDKYRSVVVPEFSDPVEFFKRFWPQYTLYDKQREIMWSVRDNYETIVPAGNELGKDFVSAGIALWFFVSRRPARVVTTSPNSAQLEDVLWGEIRRFIQESKYPLPIQYNHMRIRASFNDGTLVPKAELVGRVVQKGESMLGRHAERTPKGEPMCLLIVDEASGMEDEPYERADTWTHRKLVIGNPYPCTNFFYRGTKEGDQPTERPHLEKLYRKVIKITCNDSPNVRLAEAELSGGKQVSHRQLIPGVLSYADMLQRRKSWDSVRQCIGLDAEFYEGADALLFPPEWLNRVELKETGAGKSGRTVALGIGVDPAEGGDKTVLSAVDELGILEILSIKTPDTSEIGGVVLNFMRKWRVNDCSHVCFDRGGGGKQHADYLDRHIRNSPTLKFEFKKKFRTVGFGESASPVEPDYGIVTPPEQMEQREQRYVYFNRRAELYGRLSLRFDPDQGEDFTFSSEYSIDTDDRKSFRSQLSFILRTYDAEGRLKLPPKNRRSQKSKEPCLVDMIGHSPDEADSVVLAVFAMETRKKGSIGAF